MSPWEIPRFASRGLTANKLRSSLTMLGILIGVARATRSSPSRRCVMSETQREQDGVHGRTEMAAKEQDETPADSPFPGDLEEELARAPRARRLPGLTTYLGAGVVLAIGFAAGTQADRHLGGGGSQSASATGGFAGGASGGLPRPAGGRGPTGGGGQGSSGTTTGTVQKVSGNTIYVRTANGGTVRVKVTGATKVGVLRGGSVKDLRSGASVTVQGAQAQDGLLTATSVSQDGTSGG